MKRVNLSTWSLLHHQMVRYLLVVVVLIGEIGRASCRERV